MNKLIFVSKKYLQHSLNICLKISNISFSSEIFLSAFKISKIFYDLVHTNIFLSTEIISKSRRMCKLYDKLSSFKIYSDSKFVSSKTDFFNCGIDFQFILQLDKSKQEVINMVLPVLFFCFSFHQNQ